MFPVGFEPTISVGERQQNYASDRAATGTGSFHSYCARNTTSTVGRNSSVGVATRYGLKCPGIETRWRDRLSAPVQTGPRFHTASFTMGTGVLSQG